MDLLLIYLSHVFASASTIFLALFCTPKDFSSLRAAKAFTASAFMAALALRILCGHKKILFACVALCFLCSQQHQKHEISPHKPSPDKTNMPTMAPCTRQSKPVVVKVINQRKPVLAPVHICSSTHQSSKAEACFRKSASLPLRSACCFVQQCMCKTGRRVAREREKEKM